MVATSTLFWRGLAQTAGVDRVIHLGVQVPIVTRQHSYHPSYLLNNGCEQAVKGMAASRQPAALSLPLSRVGGGMIRDLLTASRTEGMTAVSAARAAAAGVDPL